MMYTVSEEMMNRLENDHTYHQPFGNQAERYGDIREEAKQFAYFLCARAPQSRELSLALTHIEEAVFYANAAIARHEVDMQARFTLTPEGERAAGE